MHIAHATLVDQDMCTSQQQQKGIVNYSPWRIEDIYVQRWCVRRAGCCVCMCVFDQELLMSHDKHQYHTGQRWFSPLSLSPLPANLLHKPRSLRGRFCNAFKTGKNTLGITHPATQKMLMGIHTSCLLFIFFGIKL